MCAHNDIYTNGDCRSCDRERNDRYRRRRRLAMALLHAAEARHLSGFEAISILQNASYSTLQECVSRGFEPTSGEPL